MKGTVLLPMILMIGAILVTIGMAGLLIGVVLNRSNASIRLSSMALVGAQAGIADVHRRIIRNPAWLPTCVSLASPTYTMSLGGGTVVVAVCVTKNVATNQYTAQSLGTARLVQKRRLDAVIELDPATSQVKVKSINEVQF